MMRTLIVLVVLLGLIARPTQADTQPAWANGVSAADQARANALYDEANELFARQAYAPALEKYTAAVALWDHPVIHFNMAVTLVRLDRMLEAAEALDHALRFGQTPYDAALYAKLLDYQALVRGRVGEIEATCSQDAAQIVVDGKPWFTCPGTRKMRVLAGEHTINGEHKTLVARSQRLTVVGGTVANARVDFIPLSAAVTYEYRFPRWLPWTVLGSGAVIGALGFVVAQDAADKMNQFDQRVASSCAVNGCSLEPSGFPSEDALAKELVDQRDRAKQLGRIATGLAVTSAVAVATGIVLVILNRGRPVTNLELTPTQGGVTAGTTWQF